VEFLLHQELRETPIYNSIIEAVALGNTKLNDISQKSLIENTSKTSVYLKNLIELGIVEREFYVDTQIKEKAKDGLRIAETEIYILGISREAKEYFVGECKFKSSPFTYAEYLNSLAKLTPLKQKAKFYYALFSESSFDEKIVKEANVALYDLEEIVGVK
jgi:hypothetical protein